ncbi:MAG: transcription elongation factor GreA [Firmicutes bacterium]|nr:transcription elongation factor GreA [Bacillota bacterium]
MTLAKQVILTYEGLEKLENELEHLKTVMRKEVAEKIKQALSFGDLSENSEYDEVKKEQAQMEIRIVQIEKMLKNARIIDEDDVSTDKVSLGSKVLVLDIELQEQIEYVIVGSMEANPAELKISDESPVGSALLDKKVGDVVEATVPMGTVKFEVIKISK